LQPAGLIAELTRHGQGIAIVDADATVLDLGISRSLAAPSVIVARGRSHGVLSFLRLAEMRGIPTLNRVAAIEAVVDKSSMAIDLARAGIPTPPTFIGPTFALAGELPRHCYPLILKPVRGDNAAGLRLVYSAADLRALVWPENPALAQSYLDSDGYDIKLYVIGEHVTAIRKPSPLHGGETATPIPLTDKLAELARRCGQLFDLELYGVDCIDTPNGPVVIEVNDFPNYSAVPNANERLATHVLATTRRNR
jgi:glutathione synthase/RimK-type ligase-like ATP-grasp enzyme